MIKHLLILLLTVPCSNDCAEKSISPIGRIKYRGSLGFMSATGLIGVSLYALLKEHKERYEEHNKHELFKEQVIPYITRSLVSTLETEAYKKFKATTRDGGFVLMEGPLLAYMKLVDHTSDPYTGKEPLQIELVEKTYKLRVQDNLSKITYFPKAEQLSSQTWGVKASAVLPKTNTISPQVEIDSRPDAIEESSQHWGMRMKYFDIQAPYIYPRITFSPLPSETFYEYPLQKCDTFFNHIPAAIPGLKGALSATIKCYKMHNWQVTGEVTVDVDLEASLDKPTSKGS